jgi:hemoglobin
MTEDTLYDRLGGEEAIAAVVDEFYDRVLADDDLVDYFTDTDTDALRDHQTAFISHATGGPVAYDGRDMADAHRGLDITDEDFDRVAVHLQEALAAVDVAEDDIDAVLDEVAALKPAIVTA